MFDHMEGREREREMKGQGGDEEVTNAIQGGRKEAKIGASGCGIPGRHAAWVEIMVFAGVDASLMRDAWPKNWLSQIGHKNERFSLKCRFVM